jgi:hypothetical protein
MKNGKNLCIRCGKERVLTNTWDEEIKTHAGVSVVTHSSFVCPDAECQKKVDAKLAADRKVSEERQQMSEQKERERAAARLKPKMSLDAA